MKRYIIHDDKIYYANCKKVGDKYEISSVKNLKDVTLDVITVVKEYMEYIAKSKGIENDPMVVFNDNTALILMKLVKDEAVQK